MNCDIINDLLPLYIDGCCSEKSSELVNEHLAECENCRSMLSELNSDIDVDLHTEQGLKNKSKINIFKASVMQTVLFLLAFFLITLGVALEAGDTPFGNDGSFAFFIIAPATGFMLSLTNWFFIRFYKSAESFSNCTVIVNVLLSAAAFVVMGLHYDIFTDALNGMIVFDFGVFIAPTFVFCVILKLTSLLYAHMLGKDRKQKKRRTVSTILKVIGVLIACVSVVVCFLNALFLMTFGSIGETTVLKRVDSPSETRFAQVVLHDEGALGGDTVVIVYTPKKRFLGKRYSTENAYVGQWNEEIELEWKNDNELVIDHEGQTILYKAE